MGSIPINFGGYQPPASIHNKAAEFFGRHLADRLGDEVRFSLDGNIIGSGHKAADLLTMVEAGTLNLCYFSTSYLAERAAELSSCPWTSMSWGKLNSPTPFSGWLRERR